MSRDILNSLGCSEPDLECFQGWGSPLLWEICSSISLSAAWSRGTGTHSCTCTAVREQTNCAALHCVCDRAGEAECAYSSFSPAGKSVPTLLLMLRTAAISPAHLFNLICCRIPSIRVRKFYQIKLTVYQLLTLAKSSALLLILGNANIVPPQVQHPLCWSDCPDHMISSHTGIYFHKITAKYPCFKKPWNYHIWNFS